MCISHGDWQLHHCQLSDGFKRIWVFSYMYWASESAIHSKFRIFVSGTKRGILTLPGRWKGLAKDSQLMPDLFLRLPFFRLQKEIFLDSCLAAKSANCSNHCLTLWCPSDKHLISPYNIAPEAYIEVMRMKEIIANSKIKLSIVKFFL